MSEQADIRLTDLEIQSAHHSRTIDELSDVIAAQAKEIEGLKRRVAMLLERVASDELESGGTAPLADQMPPHW